MIGPIYLKLCNVPNCINFATFFIRSVGVQLCQKCAIERGYLVDQSVEQPEVEHYFQLCSFCKKEFPTNKMWKDGRGIWYCKEHSHLGSKIRWDEDEMEVEF